MLAEKKHIITALGGQEILGRKALDFDHLIREGIPVGSGTFIKLLLKLTNAQLAETLGVSERTLTRKKAEDRLSSTASDRLFRAPSVYAFPCEVLEDKETATLWMRSPQRGLGGRVPIEMLQTEAGAHEVEDLLGRIEHGVIS